MIVSSLKKHETSFANIDQFSFDIFFTGAQIVKKDTSYWLHCFVIIGFNFCLRQENSDYTTEIINIITKLHNRIEKEQKYNRKIVGTTPFLFTPSHDTD